MKQTNTPCDTVIERHVWLGQDALLLRCPRIGAGSIVAARAVVNRPVERFVAAGGIPARTLRRNTTWGRTISVLSPGERKMLDLVRALPPHAAE
jgi:acetyltransferase-like isoleucine patch superfamily enzyme